MASPSPVFSDRSQPAWAPGEHPFAPRRLRTWQRATLLLAGLMLLAVLGTARCLEPNRAGMGTHRQLGLPPCTLVQWFGIRCPACGMTTSWAHLTRLELGSAFAANAGGALLAIATLISAPWMVASAVWGRWIVAPPSDVWLAGTALAIAATTAIDWGWRLWQ